MADIDYTRHPGFGAAPPPMPTHERYVCQVLVHSAKNLPKADTLGKIDGYVKVIARSESDGGKREVLKTDVVKSNYDPKWKKSKCFVVHRDAELCFEVYDSDTVSDDDLVGTVRLTFAQMYADACRGPQHRRVFAVACEKGFKPHDKKNDAELVLSFGFINTGSYLATARAQAGTNWTGSFSNEGGGKIYAALPAGACEALGAKAGDLAMKMEIESGGIDLFLLETRKTVLQRYTIGFYDRTGTVKHTIRRRDTHGAKSKPWKDGPFDEVYGETKMDDIKLWQPLSWLVVQSGRQQLGSDGHFEKKMHVVSNEHGWHGSLDYKGAKKTLKNVITDDSKKALYFIEKDGVLLNDFDSDNADIAFYLYSERARAGWVPDLVHDHTRKRTFVWYGKPKTLPPLKVKSDKRVEVLCRVALDDLPYPLSHNELTMSAQLISDTKVVPLCWLLGLWD